MERTGAGPLGQFCATRVTDEGLAGPGDLARILPILVGCFLRNMSIDALFFVRLQLGGSVVPFPLPKEKIDFPPEDLFTLTGRLEPART